MSSIVMREESGKLHLPLNGVIDCRSLFDHLSAEEIRLPSESSLILILAGLKAQLLCHSLRVLWWVSTQAMLSDGLSKGIFSREALRSFAESG